MNNRLGQLDPLLHSRRILIEQAITRILQLEIAQDFMSAPLRLPARHAAQLARQRDIFDASQPGNQCVGFRHESHQAAKFVVGFSFGACGNLLIEDSARSGRRRQQPHQDLQKRRLAGAIGPEQADPARLQLERHLAQRLKAAENASDPVEIDEIVQFRLRSYSPHSTAHIPESGRTCRTCSFQRLK